MSKSGLFGIEVFVPVSLGSWDAEGTQDLHVSRAMASSFLYHSQHHSPTNNSQGLARLFGPGTPCQDLDRVKDSEREAPSVTARSLATTSQLSPLHQLRLDVHVPYATCTEQIDLELLDDGRTIRIGSKSITLKTQVHSEADLRCRFDKSTRMLSIDLPNQPAELSTVASRMNDAARPWCTQERAAVAPPTIQARGQGAHQSRAPLGSGSPEGLSLSCVVRDTHSAKGRAVFATSAMPHPGACVFGGSPIAAVVHDRHMDTVCAACFAPLGHQQEPLQCAGCSKLKFCSAHCLSFISSSHGDTCVAMRSVQGSTSRQLRGMHMFVSLLQIRHEHRSEFDSRMNKLLAYSHYCHLNEPERIRYMRMATGLLNELSPLGVPFSGSDSLDVDSVAHLICAVHTNLHCISDFQGKCLGSALFPEACLFNHSCMPNCILSFDGLRLEIRTIAPVASGEELTIAYTELYALGTDRRSALQHAKRFECACSRCLSPTHDNGHLDQWLFEEALEWQRDCHMRRWSNLIASAQEQCTAGRTTECLTTLREVLEEAEPLLHPHHVVLFNARCMLVEVLISHPRAAANTSELAVNAEACATACETELFPYHPKVALMLSATAQGLECPEKAASTYIKAAERLSVGYGLLHPEVDQLKRKANRASTILRPIDLEDRRDLPKVAQPK